MATESGYDNQKKFGNSQFKTIHNLGSDRYGTHVVSKSLTERFAVAVAIEAVAVSGDLKSIKITKTAHGALVGDIFRISSGSMMGAELEIIRVLDADNFVVRNVSGVPQVGDTFKALYFITNKVDAEGSIVTSQGPVQFILDGVVSQAEKDTTVPANNKGLPVDLVGDGLTVVEDIRTSSQNVSNALLDPYTPFSGSSYLDAVYGELYTITSDTGNIGNALGSPTDTSVNTNIPASVVSLIKGVNTSLGILTNRFPTSIGQFNKVGSLSVALANEQETTLNNINNKLVESQVITTNSSTTPLGIGGVFTGASFEVTKFATINVNVFSNVDSAANGVKVEFSTDGVNWDHSHQTNYIAGSGIGYIFNVEFKFARVVYTNGAVAQTTFRLQTIAKEQPVKSSLYTLDQTVRGGMFAELVKANLTAKNPSGNYVSIDCTNGGNLKVSLEELDPGVLGQEASADSFPVVLSTEQQAILSRVSGSLSNVDHDEVAITYVGSTDDISTVVMKKATVTVGTLTMGYDGNGRLTSVVRS
jgi:hypothetical protein